MFDIGWTEFIFVSVMALLVLGPKELPGLLRAFGRMSAKVKSLNKEFRSHLSQLEDEVNVSQAFDTLSQDPKADTSPKSTSNSPKSDKNTDKSDDLFSTLGSDGRD